MKRKALQKRRKVESGILKRKQNLESSVVSNRISPPVVLMAIAIFVFVATQLVYLSVFGTKGQEISTIQKEKENIYLEIEKINQQKGEIMTINNIEDKAEDLGLVEGEDVRYVRKVKDYGSSVTIER